MSKDRDDKPYYGGDADSDFNSRTSIHDEASTVLRSQCSDLSPIHLLERRSILPDPWQRQGREAMACGTVGAPRRPVMA
jgi:hypothetical protein